MEKTTVFLPPELEKALARLARQHRYSEALLIREALARLTDEGSAPAPRLPLFRPKRQAVSPVSV